MDISNETDLTKLKAMAYDQAALMNQAQSNIEAINKRIADLSQEAVETEKK